jgi:pimeloyl-ACP methyl ester carboxylesterase
MTSPPSPLSPIPFFDLGGTGHPLHFLHANGYPPDCYKPLLELLQTQYRVFGMYLRPLWNDSKPKELKNWHPLSDDLLQFLASSAPPAPLSPSASHAGEPVIGVGHSIGAVVTLRAALRDPGKFRALVLIDPVLFVPRFIRLWKIIKLLGLAERLHPLIPGAKRRRRTFDDLERVYRTYRGREVFRYMSDKNLRIYIQGITRPTHNGRYELVYSPDWEAQMYRTWVQDSDIWRELPNLKVPALFIRGAKTDTFLGAAAKLVTRKQPRAWVATLNQSTHIVPLERPQEVFDMMQEFLTNSSNMG